MEEEAGWGYDLTEGKTMVRKDKKYSSLYM